MARCVAGRSTGAAASELARRLRAAAARGLVASSACAAGTQVRAKTVRTVQLACPPVESKGARCGLASHAVQPRRSAARRCCASCCASLAPVEVAWLYAESGGSLADLHCLEASGLVRLSESETLRDPLASLDAVPYAAPPAHS